MKTALFSFLLLLSINSSGQYVNGPANIRNSPNGDKLFSINDYVLIDIDDNAIDDWYKIELHCYVKPNQLIDKKIIKANSILLDFDGDSIGVTLNQFEINNNYNEKYWKYNELEKIEIGLTGYTFKNNIRQEITRDEIIINKESYVDSCQNTYLTYKEENGTTISLIHKCDLYEGSIIVNGVYVSVFIQESQDIKRISGAEGQESKIALNIKTDYFSNNPKIRKFSVEADKVTVYGKLIEAVQYGCCGAEDYYHIYNSSTFQKLMDYEAKLYKISIPNSRIEGYLGFSTTGYQLIENKMIVGTLIFTDGERTINKINFITKDKQKFDNILRFVPDMEFKSLNQKDKVKQEGDEIELWSKNNSQNSKDLSGFQFLIHLIDDSNGKEYIQKLDFINGLMKG
jgi:hypothetical protein